MNKENWKEELDSIFNRYGTYGIKPDFDISLRIKGFISTLLSQSHQQGRMEMAEEIERVFDGFLLQDWSGEKEVYDEIERLKIGLLSTLNKLKTNTPTTEVER